jgi:hypothetical protein
MTVCTPPGIKSSTESAYHIGKAIALLNRSIRNYSREDITDAMIFAVGCLAHAEVQSSLLPLLYLVHLRALTTFQITTGCTSALEIHLGGLEALVNRRGGIQALASHPLTFRFTCW